VATDAGAAASKRLTDGTATGVGAATATGAGTGTGVRGGGATGATPTGAAARSCSTAATTSAIVFSSPKPPSEGAVRSSLRPRTATISARFTDSIPSSSSSSASSRKTLRG